jgi:thioesterase domain-containing protein
MEEVSEFLGIELSEGMLKPYEERRERMTDAVHPLSVMVGDVRFHEHREIDRRVAERWREEGEDVALGVVARELSERLGYEVSLPLQAKPGDSGTYIEEPESSSYRISLRSTPGARQMVAFLPTMLGSGLHYSKLAQRLRGDIDIKTCRLPGATPGEAPLTRFEDLAAHCKSQLIVSGEYDELSLIGWSFGGVLALEMARQMAADGVYVHRLILIDVTLPGSRGTNRRNPDESDLLRSFSALMDIHHFPLQDPIAPASILSRSAKPFGNDIEREDLLLTSSSISVQSLFQLFKANLSALREYSCVTFDQPLIEIRSEQTELTTRTQTIPAVNKRVVTLPGDHYSIFAEDRLAMLAQVLNEALTGTGEI